MPTETTEIVLDKNTHKRKIFSYVSKILGIVCIVLMGLSLFIWGFKTLLCFVPVIQMAALSYGTFFVWCIEAIIFILALIVLLCSLIGLKREGRNKAALFGRIVGLIIGGLLAFKASFIAFVCIMSIICFVVSCFVDTLANTILGSI